MCSVAFVDRCDAELSTDVINGLVPASFPICRQDRLGVAAAVVRLSCFFRKAGPASLQHHVLNRAESDDHCGVGEAGLRDTEAVHQNFFVSLGADANERMPQVMALSEATHQIGFGVS